MATTFLTSVVPNIGTSSTTLVSAASNVSITIIGLSLANTTESLVKVSVTLTDASSHTGYYIKNVMVPPRTSMKIVNGGEKLILGASNVLSAIADSPTSIDAIVSYVQIV